MGELIRITPENEHCFFGYYDKTPWNSAENKILVTKTAIHGRLPTTTDILEIGIIDLLHKNKYTKLTETAAWNFQQGCMLQWLNNDRVIFNDALNGHCFSRILSLHDHTEQKLAWPIYAISHTKKIAISVDFSRIQQFRPGYGYDGLAFNPNDDDGIRAIDLNTHSSQLIVNYHRIKALGFLQDSTSYWIDHILFSPDDKKIAFLLRSLTADNGVYSRAFSCNSDGSDLRCLLDTGMASHADWYDNTRFAIWARKKTLVANIQKSIFSKIASPLIKQVRKMGVSNHFRKKVYGDAFLLINVENGNVEKTFADNIPANEGGGHFTFNPNRQWMLNDADINEKGMRPLMLYNMLTNQRMDVATLFTPPDIHRTPWRCDLHPRFSPSGKQICIDSVHEGYRAMYVMNVADIIRLSVYA